MRNVQENLDVLCDALEQSNVQVLATLPDNWMANLIERVEDDQRFEAVRVSREESAIAICAATFLTGRNGAAVMGTSGFMASIYAINKICYTYQIGFPILMTFRGAVEDQASHHYANAMQVVPVMNAMQLPYEVVEGDIDGERIGQLVNHSRLMKRPVAICLQPSAIGKYVA